MTLKPFLTIALLGFVGVGILLVTNHPGFAIKVTNYLFLFLLAGIIYEKIIKN